MFHRIPSKFADSEKSSKAALREHYATITIASCFGNSVKDEVGGMKASHLWGVFHRTRSAPSFTDALRVNPSVSLANYSRRALRRIVWTRRWADLRQATFFLSVQHISIFGRCTWCGDTHDEVPATLSWWFEHRQESFRQVVLRSAA